METGIPIRNLYYLLCYAWERMEECDLVDVGFETPPKDVLDLLGRVFICAVRQLICRGFERGYREKQEELIGIRGRIVVAPTVQRELPRYGRAECIFDELDHDTPVNRIIKSTLLRLVCSSAVDDDLRHEAVGLRRQFRDVMDCHATIADCRRVAMHRNNRHYGFALHLCEQILQMLLPDPNLDGAKFRDFTRDHRTMARLFEKFVRNFFEHHRIACGIRRVSSQRIAWDFGADATDTDLWPGMVTDICLEREPKPSLVIDCKFYHEVLKTTEYGREAFSSSNLYQLFTYVQNLRVQTGWKHVEGLLLYAENGPPVCDTKTVGGSKIHIATINLNQDWQAIERSLLAIGQSKEKQAPESFRGQALLFS
jgi:5-methylcytosine-specific restriction enzyme subunit McrC